MQVESSSASSQVCVYRTSSDVTPTTIARTRATSMAARGGRSAVRRSISGAPTLPHPSVYPNIGCVTASSTARTEVTKGIVVSLC